MIELDGIGKLFGPLPALRDVSFAVPTGSVCGLLGHNGAGKTTVVKILSTLLRPTSGRATVAGYDVASQPAHVRASIGVTGQDAALDLTMTGRENLALFARLRGMSRRQAGRRADELIEHFDLAHAADRQVSTYSGGMRRRVDIAVSLVVPPKVLFLDEPTTGLDPRSRREVWNLVTSLAAQDVTVLLTTQYLEEADVLSDNIVIIDSGQVIANGTADDLKRRMGFSYCQVTPLLPEDLSRVAALVGDYDGIEVDADANTVSVPAPHGAATLTEVLRRLEEHDIDVIDISLRKPSLDEVFLHLTGPTLTV
jgi:ABC-2 type transport system ATP-binding protein